MRHDAYDWMAGMYITGAYDDSPKEVVVRMLYAHRIGLYGGELDQSHFYE